VRALQRAEDAGDAALRARGVDPASHWADTSAAASSYFHAFSNQLLIELGHLANAPVILDATCTSAGFHHLLSVVINGGKIHKPEHTTACFANGRARCRFRMPHLQVLLPCLKWGATQHGLRMEVHGRRPEQVDRYVSNYVPAELRCCGGNMDVQPIEDVIGAQYYVLMYSLKSERNDDKCMMDDVQHALRVHADAHGGAFPVWQLLRLVACNTMPKVLGSSLMSYALLHNGVVDWGGRVFIHFNPYPPRVQPQAVVQAEQLVYMHPLDEVRLGHPGGVTHAKCVSAYQWWGARPGISLFRFLRAYRVA
jgi:hypothetical protein